MSRIIRMVSRMFHHEPHAHGWSMTHVETAVTEGGWMEF